MALPAALYGCEPKALELGIESRQVVGLVVDSVLMINLQGLSQARGLPQNLSNLANSCSRRTRQRAAARALRPGSLAADWPVFWIQPPRLR